MSWDKFRRKFSKQFLWITFALWTGFTFVGFFTPIRTLATEAMGFRMGPWETFWTLFYAFATYGNAGYLREQVCKYMCPYARFQGAMFDRNTLVISYDEARGEPRGSRKRSVPSVLTLAADAERTVGDCIDCKACVHVCPTGIDIRDGLQYECIACGACVDACDEVMDKMSYPRGLVRYTTQNAVEGKPSRILRPRVLVYAGILVLLLSGFTWSVTHRVPLIVDVLRDRNALYRLGPDGAVENTYTLKLINKRDRETRFRIEVAAAPALALVGAPVEVTVAGGQVGNVPVTLRAAAGALQGKSEVAFEVTGADDGAIRYRQKSSFFAPRQ
jgi:cytochrome c oxidase accessory protein FixG